MARRLLLYFGVALSSLASFHCDNMSTLEISSNPIFLEPMKQIEIDCLFVHHHNLIGTRCRTLPRLSRLLISLRRHTLSPIFSFFRPKYRSMMHRELRRGGGLEYILRTLSISHVHVDLYVTHAICDFHYSSVNMTQTVLVYIWVPF